VRRLLHGACLGVDWVDRRHSTHGAALRRGWALTHQAEATGARGGSLPGLVDSALAMPPLGTRAAHELQVR
jgi:hypothetical protein